MVQGLLGRGISSHPPEETIGREALALALRYRNIDQNSVSTTGATLKAADTATYTRYTGQCPNSVPTTTKPQASGAWRYGVPMSTLALAAIAITRRQ